MATYSLGTLSSTPVSRNNYSVTTFDSTDVFAFQVVGSRRIGLFLHDLSADADIRLYRDVNNNGFLDSSDTLLASSTRGGTSNDVIDFGVSSGRYLAQVSRFSNVSSISYDLDLSAVYDVGTVSTNIVSRNRYSLTTSDPTDTFEFRLSSTRNINLSLHNISLGDDADLRLYRDSNVNGIFDASDALLTSASAGSNRDDIINYNATAGTYFAQVVRYAPGSNGNVSYDLDISTTPSRTASNLLAKEVIVGNLTGDRILSGGVGSTDTTDTYYFSLSTYRGVNIRLDRLSADADIRLIRDGNNNGVVDAGEVLRSSSRGGTNADTINGYDLSGNYFLQVYQYSGNTSYRVTFDQYATSYA